jgi:purine-nucleoside phosphorylase
LIAIVSAYFREVKFLINFYNLKKIDAPFEIFKNENLVVIISNKGMLNSAIATTYIISKYEIKFIINFGLAGAVNREFKIGDIALINKIDNFYPDILRNHFFKEASIHCSEKVVTEDININSDLVDMESEGFFRASSKFLTIDKIFLIKVVSDYLECFIPTDEFLKSILDSKIEILNQFIESLNVNKNEQELIDEKKLGELINKFRLTHSQTNELKNRITYFNLNNKNINYENLLEIEHTNKKENFKRLMNELSI